MSNPIILGLENILEAIFVLGPIIALVKLFQIGTQCDRKNDSLINFAKFSEIYLLIFTVVLHFWDNEGFLTVALILGFFLLFATNEKLEFIADDSENFSVNRRINQVRKINLTIFLSFIMAILLAGLI